jgi:hypothetical protein
MNDEKKPVSFFLFKANKWSPGYYERETRFLNQIDDFLANLPRFSNKSGVTFALKDYSFDFSYPADEEILHAVLVRILQSCEPYQSKFALFEALIIHILDWYSTFKLMIFNGNHSDILTHWSELRRDLSWSLLEKACDRLRKIDHSERHLATEILFSVVKTLVTNADDGFQLNVNKAVKILINIECRETLEIQLENFIKWLTGDYMQSIANPRTPESINIQRNQAISDFLERLRSHSIEVDLLHIVDALVFNSKEISDIGDENLKNSYRQIGSEILAFLSPDQLTKYWGKLSSNEEIGKCLAIINALIYLRKYNNIDWIRYTFISILPEITRKDQIRFWAKIYRGKAVRTYFKEQGYTEQKITELITSPDLREAFIDIVNADRIKKTNVVPKPRIKIKKDSKTEGNLQVTGPDSESHQDICPDIQS